MKVGSAAADDRWSRMHDGDEHRKVVCRRCHHVMDDVEPGHPEGEFYHKKQFKDGKNNPCRNAGKVLRADDREVEPFERKRPERQFKIFHGAVVSQCCGKPVFWEVLSGIRLCREVRGREVYSCECSACRKRYELPTDEVRRSEAAARRGTR